LVNPGCRYLDRTQIREDEVDNEYWFRHISKGGWPFSTAAHGWPIADCTAEGT
jgi:squalene cyclase